MDAIEVIALHTAKHELQNDRGEISSVQVKVHRSKQFTARSLVRSCPVDGGVVRGRVQRSPIFVLRAWVFVLGASLLELPASFLKHHG